MESGKLQGLQIARASAALGIAYFHSWHVTKVFPAGASWPIPLLRDHGWIAVDFFFAISGFVICLATKSPRFNPVGFMIRRAFRLYPLWIATSFVYLNLLAFLGRDARQTNEFFNYSLTLLPTNGFPFYDLGWSLQHELAFYFLASVLVPLLGLRGLVGALVLGIVADHAFTLPWYMHQFFSYYGNFLAGVAAYHFYQRTERYGVILPIALGFIVLYITPTRSLYPIGLYLWLVGFVNLRPSPESRTGKIATLLGDASYSIYLIHPLVLYWIYIRLQPPLPPDWTAELWRLLALYVTCVLAVGSWTMFEQPMIWIGHRVANLVAMVGSLTQRLLQTTPPQP